jgi:predicted TIM-barrel fold metal-dependent hydrolase
MNSDCDITAFWHDARTLLTRIADFLSLPKKGNAMHKLASGFCRCCTPALGRRSFLAGTAALAAAPAVAQPAPMLIDVHHHLSPPTWITALKKAKLDSPPVNNWTPEHSLAEMERGGIATSILSITMPAVSFLGPQDAAATARECNEYAKQLSEKYPGKFGSFAALPMPHVDETLKEIAYALDVLKADGVAFMTSYGDRWLGHPDFAPVMAELNRRGAVAYTHPTTPDCCVNLASVPPSMVEWNTDTTRTIGNLIFSGTAARTPEVKFIFSHGGGTVTSVIDRFTIQMVSTPEFKSFTGPGVMAELRRFYYDTAQASNAMIMSGLTRMVDSRQILFGTDYPYRTAPEQVAGLRAFLSDADLKLIGRGNAQRLLPKWAG